MENKNVIQLSGGHTGVLVNNDHSMGYVSCPKVSGNFVHAKEEGFLSCKGCGDTLEAPQEYSLGPLQAKGVATPTKYWSDKLYPFGRYPDGDCPHAS